METPFQFDESQFNRLFPFFVRVGSDLKVIAVGHSLKKILPSAAGQSFNDRFYIPRPYTPIDSFEALAALVNQLVVVEAIADDSIKLRGQFEMIAGGREMLFVGSPWFGSMEQVMEKDLMIEDFAHHDPLIDLLHVVKSQEIATQDLKKLVETINKQKTELRNANREIHDIALFPLKNPDPLLRINFQGDLIKNNPAAARLDFFDFEGKNLRNDEFFQIIAERIDKENPRWAIEASSGGRVYSFLCATIKEEGYINIYGRDVTEKLATEKNLFISEQNFRIMGENIPGLIYLWRLNYDGSTCFEYMSPRLEAELGIPMQDLEKISSYMHPDDQEVWKEKINEAFTQNTPFEYYGRLILSDKKVVWFQAVSRLAYEDEHGKVFSGFFRNVTEQREKQFEFERLSRLASANKNGVLFTTPDGKITWVNDGFERLSGYNRDEITGKTPIELFRGPLTDSDTINHVVESFFGGQAFQVEIIYYRKNGSWFWGRSTTQPVTNEKGEVTEFFGIVEDITLEKEQAGQLKLLSKIAEENVNAVIVADAQGHIEWVNKGFETMTGFNLAEVQGKKPGQFLQGPKTNPETREYLRRQIEKGEAFECEILNYTKSGMEYWLRIHGQALKDENGAVTKYFAIEEDITLQKEAGEKLREAEARFKLAIEKMGDNVWEHNFDTGETTFSAREEDLLGYSAGEYASVKDLWWNSVVEEDRHFLQESDRAYRGGTQDQHAMEYRMRHKNGQIIWILDRGVVIESNKQGKAVRLLGTHTNITHIKHTETELAQRVNQFKSLSENIPGVIYEFEFKPDGSEGLRYVSPAIEEVFGISQSDFIHYSRFVHPDDLPRIIEKNKESREKQIPFYDESRLLLPDGRKIWHSVTSSFSYYTEEGAAVFTGFMQDITERKKAETELERQRRFYEDILNNMPADIAVFSPAHEYLFVNPKGIKDETLRKWLIGKRDEDYCTFRNKPLSIAAARRATFNKVVDSKSPDEWEEKIINAEGEPEYVLRRLFPVLDSENRVTLVLGYGIDITKRKLAEEALRVNEEKYRNILANMELGLMEIGADQRITYVNQSFCNMTGVEPEKLIGGDSQIFLSGEDQQRYAARLELRKKGVAEAYEMQPRLPNNREPWWLVSAAPKFSSSGEFEGTIVVCLDITVQKQMQIALEESKRNAEELAKAKETFLANMSHEIRTPMNAILGLSRQLKKTKLDGQQGFFLDSILTASDNLLVIINDVLDLSKIEAGKMQLEHIGFKPVDLLQNVNQLFQHRAEEKGIWLQTLVEKSVRPILIGDPYRINQIIINLASNALKFTENGGVTMGVKLVEDSANAQQVCIYVKDTGVGMSDSFLEKLFDPFAQETRSASRTFGGTGLGLTITRQLVDLMHGRMEVTSKKGLGTTFEVFLTLQTGSDIDLPSTGELVESVDLLKDLRILLVEDNSMNRLVASTILSQYGAVITEAENGAIAIDLLQQASYDVVLMDMQMPVMDGLAATRKIRKDISSTIPVIALTANALQSEKKLCLEAGMNDFISKPFEEITLLKTIAGFTGRSAGKASGKNQGPEEVTDDKLYNLQLLREISRGNEGFVVKMVKMFTDQAPLSVAEIVAAFTDGDSKKMGAAAHKLKPSIDNLGIVSLKETIRFIEKAGKTEVPHEALASAVQMLQKKIKLVVAALEKVVKE